MGEIVCPLDRISELPPFIIHQIMSHLSAKEVAQTSLLSKTWRSDFRNSFPIFDFDQRHFLGEIWRDKHHDELCERDKLFRNFVDDSLLRFGELNLRMQKLRLLIPYVKGFRYLTGKCIDKWLAMAVGNGVKEIDFYVSPDGDTMYTLPKAVVFAESLTTLKLHHCKLELSASYKLRYCALTSLTLMLVPINEQMVQKITSECLLLKNLRLLNCRGLNCIRVREAFNLESLWFSTSLDVIERVEILLPTLKEIYLSIHQEQPCAINIAGCLQLTKLHLAITQLTEEEFHKLILSFPFLESLEMQDCLSFEKFRFSSNHLKHLCIVLCRNLKTVHIDTPNLLSFSYLKTPIPISSTINAPCPWRIDMLTRPIMDAWWCLRLKEFLGSHNQIKNLIVTYTSKKDLTDLDEFKKSGSTSLLLPQVENLSLYIRRPLSCSVALLDAFFSICHPKTLTMMIRSEFRKEFSELCEVLLNREEHGCDCCHVKCWQCNLKTLEIENFISNSNRKPLNFMDVWPDLPEGNLRFRLDWILSEVM